jgi:hypothetical protein
MLLMKEETSMTLVVPPDRQSSHTSRLRDRLVVVVGGMTLIDWISQIELEVTAWAGRTGSDIQVTRLHNALRFVLAGRLFALLRVDDSGLFVRQWALDGGHQDHASLNAKSARALVNQLVIVAEAARAAD